MTTTLTKVATVVTARPVASPAAEPVGSVTPSPTLIVTVPDTHRANARADVSIQAPLVQELPMGSQWRAIGRTIDNTWLLIQLDQNRVAWVFTEVLIVDTSLVSTLPMVVPPSYQNKP